MANNCSDQLYQIRHTDLNTSVINVNRKAYIQDVLDIILLGKSRKEYGDTFDENILHLLENFASPEDSNNPGNPDLSQTVDNVLANPTIGQLWYNSDQKALFSWNGYNWKRLSSSNDVAGNSGIIFDGEQIPLPTAADGYQFSYSECSWFVSPLNFPGEVDYMLCNADSQANVTSKYRVIGESETSGYAIYQILGIKDNINKGTVVGTTPVAPSPTPLITLTPSPTPAPNSSPTPTPSPSPSLTPSATLNQSPTPTPSTTASGTPQPTPTITPTNTITPTATPTVTPTMTPSKSVAPLSAKLFVVPSQGYPSAGQTQIESPCVLTTSTSCDESMGVIIQSIRGGVAPYKVDYSNVSVTGHVSAITGTLNENTGMQLSYSGGSGSSTSPLRTGLDTSSSVRMNFKMNFSAPDICSTYDASIKINGGSNIIITDAVGNTLTLYTPSGSEGNVYVTSYTTPQGDYQDSWTMIPDSNLCG